MNALLKRAMLGAWRIAERCGYNIRRTEHFAFEDQAAFFADTSDGQPKTIFDIGANSGAIANTYLRYFPGAEIHCFEPIPDFQDQLRCTFAVTPNVSVHPVAVSDKLSTDKFFVNMFMDTSSLLETNVEHLPASYVPIHKAKEVIETQTITIDHFCAEHSISRINILKLDIQGGELAALRGAAEMLKAGAVDLIYTETFFVPFYKNHPLFGDLASFLAGHFYLLHYFYNMNFNGTTGRLFWADAIFVGPRLAKMSSRMLQRACATR